MHARTETTKTISKSVFLKWALKKECTSGVRHSDKVGLTFELLFDCYKKALFKISVCPIDFQLK